MPPSPYVRDRRRDGQLALLGSPGPGPGSRPVVNESLGGSLLVSCVEGDACLGDYVADSLCLVRRGGLRVEQREQRWFVESDGAYAARVCQGCDQRNGRAV